MTYRSREREQHRPQRRRGIHASPMEEPPAPEKTSIELKRDLIDKSRKARFIGGTIVQYDPTGVNETLRDSIKWVKVGERGLLVTTYRGRELDISVLDRDTELKEERGVLHIDRWPIDRFALAPRGVEILTII
jgi:hypothetical protein